MALPQRSIGKSRHRMVLLALTAITLLSLDLSSFGPLGTAQRFVRDVLDPVTDVAGAIASPFSNERRSGPCSQQPASTTSMTSKPRRRPSFAELSATSIRM